MPRFKKCKRKLQHLQDATKTYVLFASAPFFSFLVCSSPHEMDLHNRQFQIRISSNGNRGDDDKAT